MSSAPTVNYEKRDRVGWVTLSRPDAHNALTTEMRNAIAEAFLEATYDDEVLLVVLTGAGGQAFSTGLDLREVAREGMTQGLPTFETIYTCPKPVVAAIDGYCLAAGLELALCCDIRMATEHSTFALPEARWSVLPDYGLHLLSRTIPVGEALWMLLTGNRMGAQRAYAVGLVQALAPTREGLFADVERLIEDIKRCAPLAIQAIKKVVREGRDLPLEESWRLALSLQESLEQSEDRQEGLRAFAEKRPPQWKMR